MELRILDAPVASVVQRDSGPRSIGAVQVLRVSITDRCNFRCLYCMPAQGVPWLPKDDILTFEEIVEVVRVAADVHDIRQIKLTGGEPTVRHGLTDLIRLLHRTVPGIKDLSLTTNGMLLEHLAMPLQEAGLDRVTVSIDSLHPDRFRKITRTGDLAVVLRGLDRAEEVGFTGIKINCVVMRGINDDELADFAALTLERRLTVRFIEYMPLGEAVLVSASRVDASESGPAGGCGAQDRGDVLVTEAAIREAVESRLGPLVEIDRFSEPGHGPARVYRLARGGARGRIGFISAMSAPFCATCNRLRLTASGVLRSCLFEGGEVNLRSILRSAVVGADRQRQLAEAMVQCVRLKPDVHGHHGNEQMSRIGG